MKKLILLSIITMVSSFSVQAADAKTKTAEAPTPQKVLDCAGDRGVSPKLIGGVAVPEEKTKKSKATGN